MTELPEMPPPGAKLVNGDELLFRNVRLPFLVDGHVSSQVFEPSPADKQLLSMDRQTLSTPKQAFDRFMKATAAVSAGCLAVTVAECQAHDVSALENPLDDNEAHVVADFRAHGSKQTKRRAQRLRDGAVARGWQYGPKDR